MAVNPYYNISSFIGYRTDAERLAYENVLDFNKNWYDRASYKEFSAYEVEILKFMKDIYRNYFKWGFLTMDSSESLYIILLIYLLRFRERNKSHRKPNFLVSKLGHMVFKKAAVLLNVDLIEVNIKGLGEVDTDDLVKKINRDTFCVVGIVGTTEQGNYDDINKMDKICKKANVPLHLDAAIGGFIFPFRNNSKIDKTFASFKSILSINVSAHKYGYARPSATVLLLKDSNILPASFYPITTTYLPGGPSDEFGLIGSKPAIGLIDLYYNVITWKKKGFKDIVEETFKQKDWLIKKLKGLKTDFFIYDSNDTPIFLIYGEKEIMEHLSQNLIQKGWQCSLHNNPLFNKPSIRIVVRKHFTKDYSSALFEAIKSSLKQ